VNIVVSYRGIPHSRGRETGACIARAFRRLGHSVYEYGNYYKTSQRIRDEAVPLETDLLVYCECNDGDPQYEELKNLKAHKKVYWDFDISYHPARTMTFIMRMKFDAIFYANRLFGTSLKKLWHHSYFLPYAIDDEYHRKISEVNKEYDIGLCGSPYGIRMNYLDTLNRAGLKAKIFNGIYGVDFIRLINSFKIHLNINPSSGRGLLNARVWETTGCGTLLLTQQEDFIELFFENGKHILTFSDINDCINKSKKLLADDDARESIAQAGYALVHEQHTYVNRAQTILKTLSTIDDHVVSNKIKLSTAYLEIFKSGLKEGASLVRWRVEK
jgi:hypothetical protein